MIYIEDLGLGLGIRIGDWVWGLKFGIDNWDLGLGIIIKV